ncbi:MAG: alpha/beta fold hydrolase [bacterium]
MCLLLVAAFHPLQVLSQPTQSDVPYGTDPLQELDYYSAMSPNSPVIIVVHGGGWWTGDKSGLPYANAAQLFNDEGYAVVNINYRLTPAVTFPAHISDLACALTWAKNHASLLNGDSSRVAIYGHSAGGQMAAYLGTNADRALLTGCNYSSSLNVDGVFLTSATVDFDMTNPANWPPIKRMLGDSAAYWEVAQPINHTANNFDTKFLILCGDLDDLWYQQDFAFNDSLLIHGHCSSVKLFKGHDHNSLIANLTPADTVFQTMLAFLDSLWQGTLCPVTGIDLDNEAIDDFNLAQNYPNPFNANTTIRYDLPKSTRVVLKIYDLLGQEVRTLVNENQPAGHKSVTWDGKSNSAQNVSSGIYLYRLMTPEFMKTKKLLLIK